MGDAGGILGRMSELAEVMLVVGEAPVEVHGYGLAVFFSNDFLSYYLMKYPEDFQPPRHVVTRTKWEVADDNEEPTHD